jgi:hypothetical protein
MTPAKTHQGERLGVSPPCRLLRRPAPRSPQLAANRKSTGLCFDLNPTSRFHDSQRWTRRADAQPLAESHLTRDLYRHLMELARHAEEADD